MNGVHNFNWLLVPLFYCELGLYLALPALSIQYYAKHVLHIGPALLAKLTSVVMAPWFFKLVFGLVSDAVPLGGYHRGPYLKLGAAGATLTWLVLALPGKHNESTAFVGAMLFFSNLFICTCDVMVDSMLAAQARDEMAHGKHGNAQSVAWFLRFAGSLLGSCAGAYLVQSVRNLRVVFLLTALLSATIFAASFWLYEAPAPPQQSLVDGRVVPRRSDSAWQEIAGRLCKAWREQREHPIVLRLAFFIFISAATPNSSAAFFFFLTTGLGFTKRIMGYLDIVGVVSGMLGLVAYRYVFHKLYTKTLVVVGIVLGTLLGLMQMVLITRANLTLGIDDYWFALSDDVAESFASQLSMMPLLVAAAAVCPKGDEGLLYAGLLSVSNFGGAMSTLIGASLTDYFGVTATNFDNMWLLAFVCCATNLAPLAFICCIPRECDDHHRRRSDSARRSGTEDDEGKNGLASLPIVLASGVRTVRGHGVDAAVSSFLSDVEQQVA